MKKFKQAFTKKSKKLSEIPPSHQNPNHKRTTTLEPIREEGIPVIFNNEPLPSFKILRPELQSGVSKLQQLTQNQVAKLFDKKFQEQVDTKMAGFEKQIKSENITLAGPQQKIEDIFKDFDRSNQNLRYEIGNESRDSEIGQWHERLSENKRQSLGQFSIIHEASLALRETKLLYKDLQVKNQIINGNKQMLKSIEGDITKMAVREYENGLNMIRFLQQENEGLKMQNSKLEREIQILKMDLDSSRQIQTRTSEQVAKLTEINEKQQNKIFKLKRIQSELHQMVNHETAILSKQMEAKNKQIDELLLINFNLKEKLKAQKYIQNENMQETQSRHNNKTVQTLDGLLQQSRAYNQINSFLDQQSQIRLTSICKKVTNLSSRQITFSFIRNQQLFERDNHTSATPKNIKSPPILQEEPNFCKACKESVKQISQLQVFKSQINTTMISNIQHALDKANEMMSFYSQYVPIDYFSSEMDEDMDQLSDQLTLRGLFKHLKTTFDDTKTTLRRELTTQDLENPSSQEDDDESDHSQQNLNFKSAERVHEFLMEVIQNLVQNRGQLAQLFKDIQQSYSQLFFYIHYLFGLSQSLIPVYTNYQEFQDIHIRTINKLKGENQWLQSKLQYESYSTKDQLEQIKTLESRSMQQKAELVDLRINRQKADKRVQQLTQELNELIEKLKSQSLQKTEAQRELDQIKRERNFLNESMKELKMMFQKAIE
eukprot:403332226